MPRVMITNEALFATTTVHGIPVRQNDVRDVIRVWHYERGIRITLVKHDEQIVCHNSRLTLFWSWFELWFYDSNLAFEFKMEFC